MEQFVNVESVPTEIWAQVFQQAQKTRLVEAPYTETKYTQRDVPMSVSQVCDRFRRISVNTPNLWTSIIVDFSSKASLLMTKIWLERSRNRPLSIFIYGLEGPHVEEHSEEHSEQRQCLRELLLHIGRWREARIDWSKTDSTFWASLEIASHAPVLESLVLKVMVDEDQVKHRFLPSAIWAKSPRVRKFVVQLWVAIEDEDDFEPPEDGFSSWTISNDIPYGQLTHLRLDASAYEIVSCKDIISIFEGASNLVCCFLEGISSIFDEDIELPDPPILLGQLRHLYLEPARDGVTIDDTSVSGLLDLITAPSLLSLTIVDDEQWDGTAYEDFIARSSCALEELNFINTYMNLAQLCSYMESLTSSLRSVQVNNLGVSSTMSEKAFVTSMTERDPATNLFALCPHLEQALLCPVFRTITGEIQYYGKPRLSIIAQVLELRLRLPATPGGSNIFKTILLPSYWAQDVPPELKELCKDPLGLKIEFNDDMVSQALRARRLWERLAYP